MVSTCIQLEFSEVVFDEAKILLARLSIQRICRIDITPAGRPNINFTNVITGLNDNTDEVEPGITFNLTLGQDLRIEVGRRRDYNVRATFRDLIGGFSQVCFLCCTTLYFRLTRL